MLSPVSRALPLWTRVSASAHSRKLSASSGSAPTIAVITRTGNGAASPATTSNG